MSPGETFHIEARIDHLSEGVGCFDPVQVFQRMREAFPELVESTCDPLRQTCDLILKTTSEGRDGAFRIAIRDMQERGPKVLFDIPLAGGQVVHGTAERYWVSVSSAEKIPDDFRLRFIEFLKSLRFSPIEITDEPA